MHLFPNSLRIAMRFAVPTQSEFARDLPRRLTVFYVDVVVQFMHFSVCVVGGGGGGACYYAGVLDTSTIRSCRIRSAVISSPWPWVQAASVPSSVSTLSRVCPSMHWKSQALIEIWVCLRITRCRQCWPGWRVSWAPCRPGCCVRADTPTASTRETAVFMHRTLRYTPQPTLSPKSTLTPLRMPSAC